MNIELQTKVSWALIQLETKLELDADNFKELGLNELELLAHDKLKEHRETMGLFREFKNASI